MNIVVGLLSYLGGLLPFHIDILQVMGLVSLFGGLLPLFVDILEVTVDNVAN